MNKAGSKRFVALVMATHFPQALTMVLLATVSSALIGQHGIPLLYLAIAAAAGQATSWVRLLFQRSTSSFSFIAVSFQVCISRKILLCLKTL